MSDFTIPMGIPGYGLPPQQQPPKRTPTPKRATLPGFQKPGTGQAPPLAAPQMQDPYGPMTQGLLGQIQSQIANLGHMQSPYAQPAPDLAMDMNKMPGGLNWKRIPQAPSVLNMEAGNLPAIANAPNNFDTQGLQAQAQQSGANAGLGFLQQHPLHSIDYQQYSAGAYPGLSLPQTPTRPAPHVNPIASLLGAIGGFAAPAYAGQINAAPLQSAQNIAQMHYEDQQRQYQQALEQAQMQHANAVAGRQDALQQFTLNEQNRQRLGEYNNSLVTQDRNAGLPLTSEAAGAGTLAQGMPALAGREHTAQQASGENAIMDKYAQAQQAANLLGLNKIGALDSVAARILGIQQQRDYHDMLSQYYGGRLQNSSDANAIRATHNNDQYNLGTASNDIRQQNADTSASRAATYALSAQSAAGLRQASAAVLANRAMATDPDIAEQYRQVNQAIAHRNALVNADAEGRLTDRSALANADTDLERMTAALNSKIQSYKVSHTPNTPGRTNGPNPPGPARPPQPPRYQRIPVAPANQPVIPFTGR